MIKQKLSFLAAIIGLLAIMVIRSPSAKTAELAEIKQRGQLIVAVKDNVRPLGFNDEQGNLVGLEIDIARRLAEELLGSAEAVVLKPVTNQERLQTVLDEKVDIAIARVTATIPRTRIVDFSPYYYLDGTGLITNNKFIDNKENLAEAKIAVLYGSTTIAVIRNELPKAKLIGVKSYQEALNLLEKNKVTAFAGDRSILAGWIQQYPQYRLLPDRLSGEPLSVVMPKGIQYEDLRKQVREAIVRWRRSGWLQERIEYWGLP
ncbi:MAG: transporter substrate-binding domain-containing protein [Xenococcaceae cyanobacterium MO_188.B32]|nr:transporter substrate-binding domain-containing protein [Xenococcaceae cyanobacterium MO_188.B32]